MHRIHQSVDPREHNRNFGFNAFWWDRMVGSYLDQPVQSQQSMCLGLDVFRADADQRFDRLLLQPVRSSASESASD
jgi:sterol desaturase/sphingolipid hydroxylase (fatty acid hydroxylase superfamily)